MAKNSDVTHGFGVPNDPMPHRFLVVIPKGRNEPVEIWEDFGAAAADSSVNSICRVLVPRDAWRKVSDGLKKHLNRRLKEKKLKASRFQVGKNQVERILGCELSVLAWAIEDASADEAAIAFTRWSSHRPEELWWLFHQVDRDGGEWDDPKTGWRLALRAAFIREGEPERKKSRRPRPQVQENGPDLFSHLCE